MPSISCSNCVPQIYSTKKRVYIMMGKVIVCYCIESEGTDPGRSEVSTGETNDISR